MLGENVSKIQVICDTLIRSPGANRLSEDPIGASFPLYSRQYEAPSERRKKMIPHKIQPS